MTDRTRQKSLLVMLPKPLGDLVLCTPALRYLRRALPDWQLVWLGSRLAQELLGGTGWADDFFDNGKISKRQVDSIKELPGGGFDGIVLYSNSFRSALQAWQIGAIQRIGYRRDGRSWLLTDGIDPPRLADGWLPVSMIDYYGHLARRAVGVLGGAIDAPWDARMELACSPEGEMEIDRLYETWGVTIDTKLAALVVGGAFGPSKLWPAQRFGELADWLTGEGFRPVLIVSPGEKDIARQVSDAMKTVPLSLADHPVSVAGLKALVRRCGLMVGNDTGPAHIAAAFGLPLVTLFGPTDPRWTATGYSREVRLRRDVDCGPCQQKVCGTDHRCLNGIEVEAVQQAVHQALARPGQPWLAPPVNRVGTPFSVYEESYEPLADGTGVCHKDFQAMLAKAGLVDMAGVFACQQGQALVKPGLGVRERIRLALKDEQGHSVALYLKRFGRPPLRERLGRYLARRSLAAAGVYDFDAAQRLAQAGVAVPRPIAFGQQHDWLGERRSFAIIEELPQAQSLERLLEPGAGPSPYELLKDRRALLVRLAELVAGLHGSGYFHRDLYLCHIFLCRAVGGGEYLALIDLQRVFQPRWRPGRWRVKDLAQLCYSARLRASHTEMMRFLHAYLGRTRLTGSDKTLARAVWRKAQRIGQRQIRKERAKQAP